LHYLNLFEALEMAKNLQFTGEKANTAAEQIMKLYNMFIAVDATQVLNNSKKSFILIL